MKNHKILITLFAGLLVLSSCEKSLDLAPISEIGSNNFYLNTEQVETGVYAIYDGMQTMIQTEYALTEMRSDNSKTRTSEGEGAQFESMNVDPANSTVALYWSNNYNVIFRANTVLTHLDVVTNAAKKTQFEGEAKFARAWCHFNLVRAFGDVPLINQIVGKNDKEFFVRTPKAEVYASIISDLKDAVTMLPARAATPEGRATKGAANAMLGKVYLTMHDYAAAKTALDAVGTTEYSLLPAFNDVFYKEQNKETIFAVQFIKDVTTDSELFSIDFTSKGRATGLNFATNDLMSVVDAADKRKSTLFYLETAINRWECGKYLSNSVNLSLSGNDWIVLRYADVLLMQVEAIMAGGTSTSDPAAVAAFNAIRTRAGMPTVSAVSKDDLILERRIELAFENQRLYDLIRFGVADQVMGTFATKGEPIFTYSSTDLLLPIPQRERNLNPDMAQNPGYNQ
jgi:hypothetical protein